MNFSRKNNLAIAVRGQKVSLNRGNGKKIFFWGRKGSAFLIRPKRVPRATGASPRTPSVWGCGGFAPPSDGSRETSDALSRW